MNNKKEMVGAFASTVKEENTGEKSVDLIKETFKNVTFYRDECNISKYYASFKAMNGIPIFVPIDDKRLESYIRMLSKKLDPDRRGISPNYAIETQLDFFKMFKEPQKVKTHIRIAGSLDDGIEYSLYNDYNKVVHVSKNGWFIGNKSNFYFLRPNVSLPQVAPQHTKKKLIELLKNFVNLSGDDLILFAACLVELFIDNDHHVVIISGKQGTGKSTLIDFIQKIVDPSEISKTSLPEKTENLNTLLNGTYLVPFDNVRSISPDHSDILCRAVTGATVTKRKNYTDNELNVQRLHNAVIINGIGIFPKEIDLAQRCVLFELNELKSYGLQKDRNTALCAKLPYILGSIFNILSRAIDLKYNNKLNKIDLPRMADSSLNLYYIALAMDVPPEKFTQILENNANRINQLRSNIPVVEALKELMEKCPSRSQEGSATNIFKAVKAVYSGNKNHLPSSASYFTRVIDQEHDALLAAGLRVNIDDTGSKNTILKIIKNKYKRN